MKPLQYCSPKLRCNHQTTQMD
uniref:Uncharacterized protein n=1 Tax=Anguilla anguilla TaxID=7936 RepID=A0A0E9W9R0_ANGAN